MCLPWNHKWRPWEQVGTSELYRRYCRKCGKLKHAKIGKLRMFD